MSYRNKTLVLIVIATLTRLVIASIIELGNDEVYYRMYAQYLQSNYFDHPPMVGWLIRITTANLLLDNEPFIRLGAVLSAAATTWLLFLSGKKLSTDYTGFLAAIIYTATIYGSIIAGTFILPDSPQMVCWSGGLYLLIGIAENKKITKIKKQHVLWFGFTAGIGMLCKIHTAFLWLGFLLYIMLYNKAWLQQWVLYISAFITLLMFYPVIKWNIDHHFVTYLYHSNRVNVAGGGLDPVSFLTFASGQLFYLNPVIFPFLVIGCIAAINNKLPLACSQKRLLLWCSLPLVITATAISFFKNVLPHWTGPGYTGIILLTACYFSAKRLNAGQENIKLPRPLEIAISMLVSFIVCGILLINFYPGTLGKKDKEVLGEGDFTLDMYGWHHLKPVFEKIVAGDLKSGHMKRNAAVITNKWFPAAHLDFYVTMPLKRDLIAIGDINEIHQYAWLNLKRKTFYPGDDAYCIVPSDNQLNVKTAYGALFASIAEPDIIVQKRNGKPCRRFYVYRLKGYLGK